MVAIALPNPCRGFASFALKKIPAKALPFFTVSPQPAAKVSRMLW